MRLSEGGRPILSSEYHFMLGWDRELEKKKKEARTDGKNRQKERKRKKEMPAEHQHLFMCFPTLVVM